VLFNSFTYLVYLPIVVLLYWVLPSRFRTTLLLVASYIFYMNWIPAYGALILALTVINYFVGLQIEKNEAKRKAIFTAGIVFNLGCLCFFKYALFLIDSCVATINGALHLFSAHPATINSPELKIILPLGISFFTFEFIHYITDVYRGSKPVKNFRDFALFAAFFPSQIAGPIKRFQDFMHQLEEKIPFSAANFRDGIYLIFQGLFKKVVLGDNMAHIVSAGFDHIANLGTLDAWIAAAGFTFQIFFDFSGYTDIGRGSALLFGYKVPENFNWPFIAANLTDFWRRWHMSLSTWLRDYLFIPMGGSRGSAWRVRRNMFVTMVLGGLWHGAAWHYVIWGAFHGAGLLASKEWQDFVSARPLLAKLRPHPLWHWSGVACTILFLFIAGIIFRADDMVKAVQMAARMVTPREGAIVVNELVVSTLPLSLSLYCAFLTVKTLFERSNVVVLHKLNDWWLHSAPAQAVVYASMALVILGFAPMEVSPFIYFQF
jgi:alginate O-acetyltransferase complex protein AlgI